MAKVNPELRKERYVSVGQREQSLWKVRAAELQKEEPRLRENPDYAKIKWILYPDDHFIEIWNVVTTLLLLYTGIVSPYRIALYNYDPIEWYIAELIVNCFYFIDVILNCFLAYYDQDMNIVVSHKKIFCNYAKGWLVLDILACLPYQAMIQTSTNYSSLARMGRLPRIYKLVKMGKLMRMMKLIKTRTRVMRYMNSILQIDIGIERLVWFFLTYLVLIHLLACLWIFIGNLYLNYDYNNWIMQSGYQDEEGFDLYIIAFYWSVTTLSTVGYGEIHAWNLPERLVATLVMVVGIFFYSFIIGSLSSLLTNLDSRTSKMNRKLDILKSLSRQYKFSPEFYSKISNAIEYHYKQTKLDLDEILEDLPLNLRTQLLLVIYQQMLENNAFFEHKPSYFVAYVAPLLKPQRVEEGEIIYKKGDFASEMYFIVSGQVAMMTAVSGGEMIPFNVLTEGYYFGEIDILFSEEKERLYDVKALESSELLIFPRDDFETMLKMFTEECIEVLALAQQRHQRLKEKCEEAEKEFLERKRIKRFQSFPNAIFSKEEFLNQAKKGLKMEEAEEIEEEENEIHTDDEQKNSNEEEQIDAPAINEETNPETARPEDNKIAWFENLKKNKSLYHEILGDTLGINEEEELKKKVSKLERRVEEVKNAIVAIADVLGLGWAIDSEKTTPSATLTSLQTSFNSSAGQGLMAKLLKEVSKISQKGEHHPS
ncbi:unnamed protein product [Blepharisma stoltei]|uniref:Cyclic nucleotide-binding domain-containing protein n=1 Tax=Blepharisma stoltei TaxID=1481888 RepID=A0AAU9K588_9CILI|nr:unnamed protein product [Blepharisma stoltei]